jgi:hypothetical protein
VPTVIGWLRPVILLPASTLTGLSAAQIEALLAHELAHIRRYDYLINLLQTAVETLLFYHPAVWWISRQIREEREHCCDDLAVAACGNVLIYARALAELERLRVAAPRFAVAATGGPLVRRIQRLIGRPALASNRFESSFAGAIALAMILFIFTSAHTPVLSGNAAAEASDSALTSLETLADSSGDKLRPGTAASQKLLQKIESDQPQSETDPSIESHQPDAEQVSDQQDTSTGGPQDYIGSMRELGYTNLSVDEIVALETQGVMPEFVREANALLNKKLSVNQLIAFKVHGVTPSRIVELKAAGYENLSADELIAFRVHGVTSEFVSELRSAGYDRLPADILVGFRVHGVSTAFIQTIKEMGYDRPSPEELAALRIHNVTPQFIQAARTYIRGNLSIEQLTGLRIHGVTQDFVKELESLGYAGLSANQLMSARIHGVTPKYISAVQAFGYKPTLDQLLGLRIHGVTPNFIEAVKSRGFNDVTIEQLVELRRLNIIPGSRKK